MDKDRLLGFLRQPRRWRGRAVLLTLVGLALVVTACGPGPQGQPASGAAGGQDYVVDMNDQLQYVPSTLTVPRGATVTWRNVGTIAHTVTADPAKAMSAEHVALPAGAEPFDSGDVGAGESWSHRFDVPGEYTYFCIPHEAAGMVAHLTVQE